MIRSSIRTASGLRKGFGDILQEVSEGHCISSGFSLHILDLVHQLFADSSWVGKEFEL